MVMVLVKQTHFGPVIQDCPCCPHHPCFASVLLPAARLLQLMSPGCCSALPPVENKAFSLHSSQVCSLVWMSRGNDAGWLDTKYIVMVSAHTIACRISSILHTFLTVLHTIRDLWKAWKEGLGGQLAVKALEETC